MVCLTLESVRYLPHCLSFQKESQQRALESTTDGCLGPPSLRYVIRTNSHVENQEQLESRSCVPLFLTSFLFKAFQARAHLMNSETYYGINQPIAPECSALQALRRCFYMGCPRTRACYQSRWIGLWCSLNLLLDGIRHRS